MKKTHIPMRMCIGCNQMKEKKELIRLIKIKKSDDKPNYILIDKTFKHPGRGSYLCKNLDCLKNVRKTKRLNRIFSCMVNDSFYEKLREVITLNGR